MKFSMLSAWTKPNLPTWTGGGVNVDQYIEQLLAAWNDPGPHPAYHAEWQRRLQQEWPPLYQAILGIKRTYERNHE